MERVLAAFASIVLLAWISFHAMVIVSLLQSEVIPALGAGSFNIQTSSLILNRVWEGNELYWLLAAHATLVLVLAIVLTLSARFAIRGSRGPKLDAVPDDPLVLSADNEGQFYLNFGGETETALDERAVVRGDEGAAHGRVMRGFALSKQASAGQVSLVTEFPEGAQ